MAGAGTKKCCCKKLGCCPLCYGFIMPPVKLAGNNTTSINVVMSSSLPRLGGPCPIGFSTTIPNAQLQTTLSGYLGNTQVTSSVFPYRQYNASYLLDITWIYEPISAYYQFHAVYLLNQLYGYGFGYGYGSCPTTAVSYTHLRAHET